MQYATIRTEQPKDFDGDAIWRWLREGHRLPTHISDWAVKNGKLAYFFADPAGDTYPAYYCADCAECHIKTDAYLRCCYPSLGSIVSYEGVICDDCLTDLTN